MVVVGEVVFDDDVSPTTATASVAAAEAPATDDEVVNEGVVEVVAVVIVRGYTSLISSSNALTLVVGLRF